MSAPREPAAPGKALAYRPEIDGLRAIAVVSVILFHAGFAGFGGGYVGVDIFFVISGFLITTIILNELEAGRFSILAFYERRARRILPALVVVVLATWPAAWALMLPAQRVAFSESIAAVALFVSNLLFAAKLDYFAPTEAETPLLHTWSLAVEEQYYLLFPLILVLAWKFGRRVPGAVIAFLLVASLALAEYGWRTDPEANFFFTGSRAWELMAGALCVLAERRWGPCRSEALAALGLSMMLAAVFLFSDATPMPSVWTALPVTGAALVILAARGGGVVAGLLATRPMVAVGLVSYSAYLWHQPLFALARVRSIGTPSDWIMAALTVLTFVLAWASWRYVETPFRRRPAPLLPRRRQVFAWSGAALAGMLALAVAGWAVKGNEAGWLRAHPGIAPTYRLLMAARASHGPARDLGPCVFNLTRLDEPAVARVEDCAATLGPALVVLGDSHGIDVYSALGSFAGQGFVLGLTGGGCRPTDDKPECLYDDFAAFAHARRELLSAVLFVQAGAYMLLDERGVGASRQVFLRAAWDEPLPELQPDMEEVGRVADYLQDLAKDLPVTWLAPRIEPQVSPNLVLRSGCAASYALRPNQREAFEKLDRAIAAEVARRGAAGLVYAGLDRFPAFDMQSDFMSCEALFWSDGDHWSPEGETLFGQRIVAAGLPGLERFGAGDATTRTTP